MKKFILGLVLVLLFSALCTGCNAPGAFYSLDEAYDNGWLTQEDLKNIAYYYNSYSAPDLEPDYTFIPEPIDPNQLDNQTIKKMKKTYQLTILKDWKAPLKSVFLKVYYGTYQNCVIAEWGHNWFAYDPYYEKEKMIGDVLFYNYNSCLLVWREG